MAQERIYESQVDPRAAAALPMASPASQGAAIGAALEDAGQAVHAASINRFKIQRDLDADRELSDFSHKFALERQNFDGMVRHMRSSAAPGAAGHVEGVTKLLEQSRARLLGTLKDPRVQRRAQAQLDEYGASLMAAEGTFAEGKRVAKVTTDFAAYRDASRNRIRSSEDPEAYKVETRLGLDYVRGLNVDEDTRAKLADDLRDAQAFGYVQRLQDSNPRAARERLDAGQFDFLPPDALEQLRSGADVETRRLDAAAEHAANMAKAEIKEGIATLEEANRQGLSVPDEQFVQAIGAANAIGDQSTALKLEGLRADNQFAKIYEGQSPLQLEQRLATLAGIRNPNASQQRELKWLQDHRGSLNARYDEDPVGWAIEHSPAGLAPPPGDISDPGVIQARIAWARKASRAYGRPMPYLSKAEAEQIAAHKQAGAGGEAQALELLDRWPNGRVRAQVAKQVDADDFVFQHLALLNPKSRTRVRAGAAALKANPQFLKPSEDAPEVAEMMAAVEQELDKALKLANPADIDATKQVARQFIAGIHAGTATPVDKMSESQYRLAVRVALGGKVLADGRNVGGLGNWAGTPFVLPEHLGNPDFWPAVVRDMKARKVAPINPDGSPADLRYARPVMVSSGVYRWETREGRPIAAFGGGMFLSQLEPGK